MEFRLLGPLEVVEHDRVLVLGGGRQRALFAMLLLHANEVVSADRLIDELWGGRRRRPRARSSRSTCPGCARSSATAGWSPAPPATCCASTAPSSISRASSSSSPRQGRADPRSAAQKLRRALALWRGPPLAELAYEPFAQAEIVRLEELRWAALEQRIDADLAAGRHTELVGELEALIAEHPLRERLRCQLMLALYRSGRQAEALDVYRHARRELSEQLGLEPGEELKRLEQAILRQDPALARPRRSRDGQP